MPLSCGADMEKFTCAEKHRRHYGSLQNILEILGAPVPYPSSARTHGGQAVPQSITFVAYDGRCLHQRNSVARKLFMFVSDDTWNNGKPQVTQLSMVT